MLPAIEQIYLVSRHKQWPLQNGFKLVVHSLDLLINVLLLHSEKQAKFPTADLRATAPKLHS